MKYKDDKINRIDVVVDLRRILVHEIQHLTEGGNVFRETRINSTSRNSSRPKLRLHGKEPFTIHRTNKFMMEHFGQAARFELQLPLGAVTDWRLDLREIE